jgi:hypothetical protein
MFEVFMWEHIEQYLKVEDLKEGYTYRIHARNATVGIWTPEHQGFLIKRDKFGVRYLFTEIHWDLSEDFGTAKPVKELEKAPFEIGILNECEWQGNPEILKYLADLDKGFVEEENKIVNAARDAWVAKRQGCKMR